MENKYKYLSAGLFVAGAICLVICFTHNIMLHLDALSELSGALMISGLLIFLKKQKKPDGDAAPKSGSPENEVISRCEKILSDVHQQMYGDDTMVKKRYLSFQKNLENSYIEGSLNVMKQCVWCGM